MSVKKLTGEDFLSVLFILFGLVISRVYYNRSKKERARIKKELKQKGFKVIPDKVYYGIMDGWADWVRSLFKPFRSGLNYWREEVIKRDGFQCRKCKAKDKLEAYHIYNYKDNLLLRADINNGITLCRKCHREFHRKFGRKKQYKRAIK